MMMNGDEDFDENDQIYHEDDDEEYNGDCVGENVNDDNDDGDGDQDDDGGEDSPGFSHQLEFSKCC